MAKIIVTNREGVEHTVEGDTGLTVMEVLRDNDMDVEAICGGCCSCATCHVYIDSGWQNKLSVPEDDEKELVEELEYHKDNSRLSCQIEFTDSLDGLTLTVAPSE